MVLATRFRDRCALAFVLLLVALPAGAEQVTHQFTGQLTTITDGSAGRLDLRSVFSLGQAVTLEYTIERGTSPTEHDPYTDAYTDGISALSFSIDAWSGSGTPIFSLMTVTDNAPSPGNPAIPYDQNSVQIQGGITAPEIGGSTLQSLNWTFDDVQGTVFDSKVIPNTFPDLAAFEGRTLTVLVFNFSELKSGYVMATLAGVTTPAQPSSWGQVKALYR
jgi:hypothetical protein